MNYNWKTFSVSSSSYRFKILFDCIAFCFFYSNEYVGLLQQSFAAFFFFLLIVPVCLSVLLSVIPSVRLSLCCGQSYCWRNSTVESDDCFSQQLFATSWLLLLCPSVIFSSPLALAMPPPRPLGAAVFCAWSNHVPLPTLASHGSVKHQGPLDNSHSMAFWLPLAHHHEEEQGDIRIKAAISQRLIAPNEKIKAPEITWVFQEKYTMQVTPHFKLVYLYKLNVLG